MKKEKSIWEEIDDLTDNLFEEMSTEDMKKLDSLLSEPDPYWSKMVEKNCKK